MKAVKLTEVKAIIRQKKKTLFHERLTELRSIYNMTQVEIAKILDLSTQSISNYETAYREPTLDRLMKIADIFHVPVDWLLGRDTSNDVDPANVLKEIQERKRLEKIAKLKQELAELEVEKP